jgi:DNA repair protein RecO
MHHKYSTPGFILESKATGESSRLLFIFTREVGMVGALAQGVRFGKSKLRYHLRDFSVVLATLVRGKELWRLVSAGEIAGEPAFEAGSEELKIAARILTLLRRLLSGEEKDEALFDELRAAFAYLRSGAGEGKLKEFESLAVLRILSALGYVGGMKDIDPAFLSRSWDTPLLDDFAPYRPQVVHEINRSIRESQL